MSDRIKNIFLIILGVLFAISLAAGGFLFWKLDREQRGAETARVEAQNRIAELSDTIQENENTWSRLAQEKEVELDSIRSYNAELADIIEGKDQEITTLTTTVARLRNVRVVVNRENVEQTEEPTETGEGVRHRVEFDQTWNEFMRIQGFTLTNPAEAEINVGYTRNIRISVVTTQNEDLSWQTYVETDAPNLEIGEIESIVNPISRPQEGNPWYRNIMLGVGVAVAVDGNMGQSHIYAGYDAGDWDLGVILGVQYSRENGAMFAPGFQFSFAPFAL